uniref:Uncharacterized protein n=1 Tax=Candidatus Kentrum sp. DK TaxID=2126562 RepID=A0A450SH11_9GAMM|nr:MAG: hypothetical protein BECKDK2373C_GA0170839_10367 [Candidatus Kentron sp. DK]
MCIPMMYNNNPFFHDPVGGNRLIGANTGAIARQLQASGRQRSPEHRWL